MRLIMKKSKFSLSIREYEIIYHLYSFNLIFNDEMIRKIKIRLNQKKSKIPLSEIENLISYYDHISHNMKSQ